jgi:hypothetical protein
VLGPFYVLAMIIFAGLFRDPFQGTYSAFALHHIGLFSSVQLGYGPLVPVQPVNN